MENLRIDLSHDEILTVRSCSTISTVRSKIVIENSAGIELFIVSFKNDGSEYCFQEKGKTKFYKIKEYNGQNN